MLASEAEHFDIMRSLILRSAPDTTFTFLHKRVPAEDASMRHFMQVKTDTFTLSVFDDSVWTDVYRSLAKKLACDAGEWTCDICCEVASKRVSCNKCSNESCGECYIRSFVHGEGVIVCAFCRQRTGQRFSPHMIGQMVDEIRQKLVAGTGCRES